MCDAKFGDFLEYNECTEASDDLSVLISFHATEKFDSCEVNDNFSSELSSSDVIDAMLFGYSSEGCFTGCKLSGAR